MMIRFATLALLLCACVGCSTNPVTGRSHFDGIPDSMMNSMGAEAFAEIRQGTQESADGRLSAIVRRVADRIIAQTDTDFDWEVRLVNDPQANAFVLPGGKIVVYTGILPVCETEAGLAFVMGHEVGHAIAKHGEQRVFTNVVVAGGLTVANLALNDQGQHDALFAALGAGAQVGVILPFSRDNELEADEMGLVYMAQAGYDPTVGPGLWERMGQLSGGQAPPEYLSTHPSHTRRAQDLRDQMDRALEIYDAAPAQHGLGERF